ncbi:ATP-dependent helicase HrpB [Pseudidiomarina insulisalsae]|uniref:ATP-dependent helicase HrpB n=1 Tax=Pseudidiomarina insulisalsae TaxID=575789 RepID=A0A432YA65_9GAMM|nr:ATP-dependent helicase HrpB [Pseudidiomarina insulisalsae]RUO57812.1 ATP-dependent helicase HrpB [Pseudidiomarina insulisalsae]
MTSGQDLPVVALLPELIAQLPGHKLVLQAPPGAGKSTALPLALLQAEAWQQQRILLLQPRRVAALSIAHFLARQLGEKVGATVGYHVRGDARYDSNTRLLIVTEGTFTQYLQQDPELSGVGVVIFDEFHERNLYSDLGLAMLQEALALRPDLAVLVMSATLPAQAIADWLGDARVLSSAGRQHPISIEHHPVPLQTDWLRHAVDVVQRAARQAEQGVLVFLPGWREISYLSERLELSHECDILPLHRQLPLAAQQAALAPAADGRKKVVLATNIAETSLTIPGIDVVVDSGWERRSEFSPRHGVSRLLTKRISKASATQRAGRAGRLGPGRCLRLWASNDEPGMREFDAPAIATDDLSGLLLEAKRWGSSVAELRFFSEPNPVHLQVADDLLQQLGVLDEQGQLTVVGQQVAAYGNDPRLARIAVAARKAAQPERAQAALLLAQLEASGHRGQSFPLTASQLKGEQRQRLQWWRSKLQVTEACEQLDLSQATRLALWGYPDRVARRRSATGGYLVAYGGGAQLHHQDARAADALILLLSMSFTDRQPDAIIGDFINLTEADLRHPALSLAWRTEFELSGPKQRLQAIESQRLGALVLAKRPASQQPDATERVQLLVEWVQRRGTELLAELLAAEPVQSYLSRVRLAAQHLAAQERRDWPDFSAPALQQQLAEWAAPYWTQISSLAELRQWSPLPALQARLNFSQQQLLNEYCPTHWQAPSGLRHRIDYSQPAPLVALKLQEVFGEPVSPSLCRGRVILVLELLSPAQRPLQRTADLASFWQNAYQQVKKEMKGRYPKHPWPDDPLQAQATQKTKRMLNNEN